MGTNMGVLQEVLDGIPDIAERARTACMLSPEIWVAVHGVPLNEYLGKLSELEAMLRVLTASQTPPRAPDDWSGY